MNWQSHPCMLWSGRLSDQGYGVIARSYRASKKAHVAEWEKVNGPVPAGLVLDHLCRNRACVNPAHLEPVTSKENTLRGIGPTAINAAKTECKRGHPLSGDNLGYTYLGYRYCKKCQAMHSKADKQKRREAKAILSVNRAAQETR